MLFKVYNVYIKFKNNLTKIERVLNVIKCIELNKW